MCRITDCNYCAPTQPHLCRNCGILNSCHRTTNCTYPKNSNAGKIILCRAMDCNSCGPGQAHYCKICKKMDVDHRSINCPTIDKKVQCVITTSQPSVRPIPMYKQQVQCVVTQQKHTVSQPSITAATMSVITKINGINHIIISLRSDSLRFGGSFVTTGGSKHPSEDPLLCAMRECLEEHGITVRHSDVVYSFRSGKLMHYIAFIDSSTLQVNGPEDECEWEITSTVPMTKFFPKQKIIDMYKSKIWAVPVNLFLSSPECNNSCMRTICREFIDNANNGNVLARYV